MFLKYYNTFYREVYSYNLNNPHSDNYLDYTNIQRLEERFAIFKMILYLNDKQVIIINDLLGNLLNINYGKSIRLSRYSETVDDANLIIAYELILKQLEDKNGI